MNIRYWVISIMVLMAFHSASYAESVSLEKARMVAKNYFSEKITSSQEVLIFNEEYIISEKGTTAYYVFNINDGFIIISADNTVFPILGYSFTNNYSGDNFPPAFKFWMNQNKKQILFAIEKKSIATKSVINAWLKYASETFSPGFDIESVEPLLQTTWSQGCYYNSQFPEDTTSPCGHLWTGCVATAMGQIMKYYNYPKNGTGSNGYNSSYGWVEADFENTVYDWAGMKSHLNEDNNPVAELLYHAAISINSQFFPNGTGAFDFDARDALVDYFDYRSDAQFYWRDAYQGDWTAMLRAELDAGRPFLYGGADSQTSSGHTLVCDGYQDTAFFHFNWGWNGTYNGYFYLDSLVAGSNHFDIQHDAVVGITPNISGIVELYPPENLIATVDFKNVTLNWEVASISSSLELIGYQIYRNDTIVTESVISGLTYSDLNVSAGSHEYKVQSVFIGEGNGPFAITEVYISNIEDQHSSSFIIYPNPVSDIINIRIQDKDASKLSCSIVDMNGQIIFSEQLGYGLAESVRLEIPSVATGVYLLQIRNGSTLYSKKILIRN